MNLVYKYLPPRRIDILRKCQIRFTSPAAFNDPFESLPVMMEYKAQQLRAIEEKEGKTFREGTEEETRYYRNAVINLEAENTPTFFGTFYGLQCFSKVKDSLLMWSHYADAHRGFVIGFDADNGFFAPGYLSVEGLKAVGYSTGRYVLPERGFSDIANNKEEMAKAIAKLCFTKSIKWAYEKEMRLLAPANEANDNFYPLPSDAIREVILGIRITENDRKEIADLLKAKYSHATLLQAKVNPEQFALDFIPYADYVAEQGRLSVVISEYKRLANQNLSGGKHG